MTHEALFSWEEKNAVVVSKITTMFNDVQQCLSLIENDAVIEFGDTDTHRIYSTIGGLQVGERVCPKRSRRSLDGATVALELFGRRESNTYRFSNAVPIYVSVSKESFRTKNLNSNKKSCNVRLTFEASLRSVEHLPA